VPKTGMSLETVDMKFIKQKNGYLMKQIYTIGAILLISFSVQAKMVINSFCASRNNNNVMLTWSTMQELNNDNFEVQRSYDGNNWSVVAIMLGAGNPGSAQQYSFTDKNITVAVAYYRIRQVDLHGRYEYSTINAIKANETASATRIHAGSNRVNIAFNREIMNPVSVRVLTMNGQIIARREHQQTSYPIIMNLNGKLTGTYMVQLNDHAGWNEIQKVIF
jgi:hypothetical protein